jgi:ribosomal protein S18 acetylase RimI-like enzyme
MKIVNGTIRDIETIFTLYDNATAHQKTKFDKHWQGFDRSLIEKEIRENRLWKIMLDGSAVCVFSIAYLDPFIWGQKNDAHALYIHRIAANQDARGKGCVKFIVNWAQEYGQQIGKKFIRMDTWGDNKKLIDYYTNCGFTLLGTIRPTFTNTLPKHYGANFVALLEMNIQYESRA